ncbi:MAG TPA: beta-N-acetylhexosaminidase [Thermoanaerobaculia bacterium]|nr:beta-N-acetylhexosaminidase [Thermoanaerobaculia bacterium]
MSAAEHVFVGIPGPELDSASAALLAEHQPGGVVFFKRNIQGAEQLGELVREVRKVLPEAVLCIDAEGGRVDRLKDVVGPAPSAELLRRRPTSLSLQAGLWIAQSLRLFDLDVDFAPVVDLDRGETDNALDGRYLGASPAEIIPRARAFLRGLHMGGAGGSLKHFPGLGGAAADTHFKVASVYLPSAVLMADLDPFDALARLSGSVMVSHAIYPAYDAEQRPATLSPAIIGGVLRGRLQFDGLCFSDDLEMKALDEWGNLAERSVLAFGAGCDVLLLCHTLQALPEVVARLEDPQLEERRAEAHRRLEVYRQRLRTLRSARDYINLMREGKQGERLENVKQAFEQMQAGVEEA